MVNHQTKKRTKLELERILVDVGRSKSKKTGKARKSLAEAMFTTRALEK